ncbi:hypothetical protein QJ854_gp548 [Moumouvirus goulette]|uniref:Uncharacterized protein n=1 Tax=Moumouvirus goulette TaxID=1247379 RepID=M1PBE0_9VIRU|nr:hypothetical protein QJ854_gp548 [Moumouvirus goulette]AGF85234.1 hypothetical protein glt_00425 [Moumouvirus goulette]
MGNNSSRENISESNDISLLKEYWANKYKNPKNNIPTQFDDNGYRSNIEVFHDPNNGVSLPYINNRDTYYSDIDPRIIASENPRIRYVEFEVCDDGDIHKMRERYVVNKTQPDHDCGANCNCLGNEALCNIVDRRVVYDNYSPTSAEPIKYNSEKKYISQIQQGGQNQDLTSVDDTTTELDTDIMSTTSVDDNTSEPQFGNKKNQIKKISDNNLIFDSDDIKTEDISLDDEDDEDEMLEDIDEELEELGFDYDKTDVTTSDLYNLQKRIFQSSDSQNSENSLNSMDDLENEFDEDETTENVRWAMQRINLRNTLFDKEDNDIMQMNSSDIYRSGTNRKNNKYQ